VQESQTNSRHALCNIHATQEAHELIDSGNAGSARRLRCFIMPGAALFLVAMAVRLLHLWAIRDTAFFTVLMGDARAYDLWAQRLAAGDWIGTDVFYQAPL